MDSIVAVLKDTPIPTILVVSGIVFLFLALAGQVAGKLEVPPERQKWSALAGAVLLSAGLLLYIIPDRPVASQAGKASTTPVSAAQPTPSGQSLAAGSGGAAPTLSGQALTSGEGEAGKCFEEIFSGIPGERVESVEIGKAGKELLGTHQAKNELAGLVVNELGRPVVAITYLFFEDDALFKIGSVVNAACQPLDHANGSRGGPRDVLENWDTLEVTTASGIYYLRFGYSAATVELDTSKSQQ